MHNYVIFDNKKGILEEIDIENMDYIGLQFVTSPVDKFDGELELKRNMERSSL